jgi:hypothetical protein
VNRITLWESGQTRSVEHIATLAFTDSDSHDHGHMIIRAGAGEVALAVTLRTSGDIEVVMPAETCRELTKALTEATRFAKAS